LGAEIFEINVGCSSHTLNYILGPKFVEGSSVRVKKETHCFFVLREKTMPPGPPPCLLRFNSSSGFPTFSDAVNLTAAYACQALDFGDRVKVTQGQDGALKIS
jgi:hypothetical protein